MFFDRPTLSVAVLVIIASCATVPFDELKAASTAFTDTDSSKLGRSVLALTSQHPGLSGFYPLTQGIDALAARLISAERAERSIDAQYYFVLSDMTGRLFLHALFRAAERGVRVRLLIDDIHTKGYDEFLAALHTHPNIEIRLYNPFANRSARWRDFIFDLPRVNQRMHNKSFTVDNQITIVGGRNIGDEYFDAREDFQFGDIDLFGIGPIAQEVSRAFDDYWNSEGAVPVDAIVEEPTELGAAAAAGKKLYSVVEDVRGTPYAAALESSIVSAVEQGTLPFYWADAQVIYDSPNKIRGPVGEGIVVGARELTKGVDQAEREFFVMSPYFVPQKSGVEFLGQLRERGVHVIVITNSLAATDVSAVHAGYAKYRKDLLDIGVELWETSPEPDAESKPKSGIGYSRSSLHAKLYIVDRRYIYVGSLNWGPRSLNLNTELGIVVDSAPLAEQMTEQLNNYMPRRAYRLHLNDRGNLEWLNDTPVGPPIYTREPETGFWRRFSVAFLKLLPIEGQL
jgi:putative cardiolipin synthase